MARPVCQRVIVSRYTPTAAHLMELYHERVWIYLETVAFTRLSSHHEDYDRVSGYRLLSEYSDAESASPVKASPAKSNAATANSNSRSRNKSDQDRTETAAIAAELLKAASTASNPSESENPLDKLCRTNADLLALLPEVLAAKFKLLKMNLEGGARTTLPTATRYLEELCKYFDNFLGWIPNLMDLLEIIPLQCRQFWLLYYPQFHQGKVTSAELDAYLVALYGLLLKLFTWTIRYKPMDYSSVHFMHELADSMLPYLIWKNGFICKGRYKLDVNVQPLGRLLTAFLGLTVPGDFTSRTPVFQRKFASTKTTFLACLIRLASRYDAKELEHYQSGQISPLGYYDLYLTSLQSNLTLAIDKVRSVLEQQLEVTSTPFSEVNRLFGELYEPFEMQDGCPQLHSLYCKLIDILLANVRPERRLDHLDLLEVMILKSEHCPATSPFYQYLKRKSASLNVKRKISDSE